MNTESGYMNKIHKNITFETAEDALSYIGINVVSTDVLETGSDSATFFSGELVIYVINNDAYSGVVIHIRVRNKKNVYLVVKRLGVPGLYDIITMGNEDGDGGVIVVFDSFKEKTHKANKFYMSFQSMIDTLTYGTANTKDALQIAIQDSVELSVAMTMALNEISDADSKTTIH